jgi:hypothetical protein
MRSTSRNPSAWISSGVRAVVVCIFTRNAYASAPPGRLVAATSSAHAGRYSSTTNARSLRSAGTTCFAMAARPAASMRLRSAAGSVEGIRLNGM